MLLNVKKIIAATAFFELVLVFLQFIFQRSFNLTLLGERNFDAATVAIAHTSILGSQFLRPYGTFPHPNVMGAYFTLSIIVIFFFGQKFSFHLKASKLFLLAILITGAVISFSRTTLIALFFAFIVNYSTKKAVILASIASIIFIIIATTYASEAQIPSIAERLVLSQAALEITQKSPLYGVGTNNFIVELAKLNLTSLSQARLLQPVHNVFLLILTENGIIGLLLFLLVLFQSLKNANTNAKLALLISIVIFASFDHFLWTLEQGQIIFWFSIALINSKLKKSYV